MSTETPRRTFVVLVEDIPGVLDRVASLFRRRAYNIESLAVGPTDKPGVSHITVVMQADDRVARLVEANLYKLVNVIEVKDISRQPSVVRDLALIRVKAEPAHRAEILQVAEVFRSRVVDVTPESLILEITGTGDKIRSLVDVLRPFGILEMAHTGAVALARSGPGDATSARAPQPNPA